MKRGIYIAFLILIWYGCAPEVVRTSSEENQFALVSSKTSYVAGESIQIQFQGNSASPPQLWLNSAFGSSVLQPDLKESLLTFTLPKFFTQKSGECSWTLVHDQKVYAEGKLSIGPHPIKKARIASYLGPRSITAGGDDFTMLVTVPTDHFDNPLADSTRLTIKKQFTSTLEETPIRLKNGIGWTNLHSSQKSGRLLISASLDASTSKELTAIVHPAKAVDFNITYARNHAYADGNQVITFTTGRIKDEFGNTVSDGTLVNFLITDPYGMILQTTGTTINGSAEGKLLHPDKPSTWSVTAYITGAAQSNSISLDFEPALNDFKVSYSGGGRTLTLSELHSFMGQLVPDGIPISLEIHNSAGALLETLRTTSRLGTAQFKISEDFYPKGSYQLTVDVAGIRKTKKVTLQ